MSLSQFKPRKKKCRNRECRREFMPDRPMQAACCPRCAIAMAVAARQLKEAQKAKQERAEARQARERLKTKSDHAREAQQAFNAWVRLRDHDLPCISCGRFHQGQWHAGHYRTVGGHRELRFEPLNCHKQCAPCNNHKSGDVVNYRINLIQRIGAENLDWLEGPHDPKRYTIEDLKEIKARYRAMARELAKKAA